MSKENTPNNEITDIEELHRLAILNKQTTYIDPPTGFTVFTELAHLKRGKCCGNLCRHCPYGWSNVKGSSSSSSLADGGGGSAEKGRVKSGDREQTQLLVKKIFDGTYYDNEEEEKEECCRQEECNNCNNADRADKVTDANYEKLQSTNTNNNNNNNNTSSETSSAPKSRGQGGRAGGSLTSKNVPYTRKGDSGTSVLFTGERRVKHDVVFEALGTVDELSCVVGVCYAELVHPRGNNNTHDADAGADAATTTNTTTTASKYGELPEQLLEVMSRLLDVGSHIARPKPKSEDESDVTNTENNNNNNKSKTDGGFLPQHTALLEDWIDSMTEQLPELTSFILPTGTPASAQLHVARTVCRRAERRMVPLVQDEGTLDPETLSYVNRLSDYFFTAARFVNYCEGRDELQYRREQRGVIERGRNDDISLRERVVVKLKDRKE